MKDKVALFVSPHTDDAEIACGGMMVRLLESGWDVHYIALSACEKSVPKKFPSDILRHEVKEATKTLGIKSENVTVFDFEVRDFPEQRQGILEKFFKLEKNLQPDMVVSPSSYDLHQDHVTTQQEVLRAFRRSTILGFEMPWDNVTFQTHAFVPLEEKHIKKKLNALSKYKSQEHRDYMTEEYIRGIARTRGMQINEKYAEAFEVIRWVMRNV